MSKPITMDSEPVNYIFAKEDALDMLLTSLALLNMIPLSGHGDIKLVIRDWVLIDTDSSLRLRPQKRISDEIKNLMDVAKDKDLFEVNK